MFRDRAEAGRMLAEQLLDYNSGNITVLAIPRGGVVVGYEIALLLETPLDIVIPRKIGAPGEPEFAIGAVTEDGEVTLDSEVIKLLKVPESYIEGQKAAEVEEIKRRMEAYRGGRPKPDLSGRVVIIVDDGMATGFTMRAAVRSIRRQGAAKVVVAVPVAPKDAVDALEGEVEEVVCLETPKLFYAISQFYIDFEQVSDDEVRSLLDRSSRSKARSGSAQL